MLLKKKLCSVADPGSGAFLTLDPEYGIGFFPDPGSRIPNPYFENLRTNFWVNGIIILWLNNILYQFKNKIIYYFMIFVATKNGRTKNFSPSFGAVVGSEIRNPGWTKMRIWDTR
jgi:hypothetical protein